jgi:hypothetical protein
MAVWVRAGSVLPLALCLALLAPATAMAQPGDPGPDPSGPNGQSHIDGCTREPVQLIHGESPSWAYVYDDHTIAGSPPPQHMSGLVQVADYKTGAIGNPLVEAVHPSGDDLPSGHDDYDLNVNILPDPQFRKFLGGHNDANQALRTGNFAANGEDYGAVHSELQSNVIPKALWPEPGDRIDLVGNWAWDCGHWGVPTEVFSPDYVLPKDGQPCLGSLASIPMVFDPAQCYITGESTEFHPWRAMWDIHHQSANPFADSEGLLYVSTDETRAGLVENCAHQNPPIGGTANPLMKLCTLTGAIWQDVSGDYSYYLPAPPRPSAQAHLVYHADDVGSTGAPAPTLTPEGNGVRVTFHLATAPNQVLNMYYKVFAGWDDLPLAQVPTHLHVSFDQVAIHGALDCPSAQGEFNCGGESLRSNQEASPPGEWNLFYDVQGTWGQLFKGEFDVHNGDTRAPNQAVDVYVPPGAGWRLLTLGRECDLQLLKTATGSEPTAPLASCPAMNTTGPLEIADGNDVPGRIINRWPSAAASLGTHTADAGTSKTGDSNTTCPPDNHPHGCYSLTYTVTEVSDAAGRVRVPSTASNLPNTLIPAPSAAAMAAISTGVVAMVLLLLLVSARRRPAAAEEKPRP